MPPKRKERTPPRIQPKRGVDKQSILDAKRMIPGVGGFGLPSPTKKRRVEVRSVTMVPEGPEQNVNVDDGGYADVGGFADVDVLDDDTIEEAVEEEATLIPINWDYPPVFPASWIGLMQYRYTFLRVCGFLHLWGHALAIHYRCKLKRQPTVNDLNARQQDILWRLIRERNRLGRMGGELDHDEDFNPAYITQIDPRVHEWLEKMHGDGIHIAFSQKITSFEGWTDLEKAIKYHFQKLNVDFIRCFGMETVTQLENVLEENLGDQVPMDDNTIFADIKSPYLANWDQPFANLDCNTFECPEDPKPPTPPTPPPKEGICFAPYPPLNERFFLFIQSS